MLVIVTILISIFLSLSCGSAAAPDAGSGPAEQPANQQQPQTSGSGGSSTNQESVLPTATPAPVEPVMVESRVTRLIEAQGEITQETNQHCSGGRPIGSNFRPAMELLLDVDPKTNQLVPWLAEQWESTPDATSWTFHLRQGVPFHFGYGELTAKDFEFMALAKGNPDCLSSTSSFWKLLDRVEITDDYTITFHMQAPAYLLADYVGAGSIGSELYAFSSAQHDEVGYENMDKVKPAGTSYYQFKERNLGESIVHERVPYQHWRATPPFEEYEQKWIGEESTRLAGLLAGEIHAIALARDLWPEATERGMKVVPAQQAQSQLTVFFGGMYFIPGDPAFDPTTPWADVRVRQAMNQAINRDELNQFILRGEGERMYVASCCHPVLYPNDFNPQWETKWDEMYGYNPDKAERLLVEAGFGPDHPFDVTLINYRTRGEPESPMIIEALPQYWEPLGINVTVQDLDTGAATKLWRQKELQHGMWANVFGIYPTLYRVRYNTSFNSNSHYFDHPFVDQKYEEILAAGSREEVDRLGMDVTNFWYDQFWTVPMFFFRGSLTVNPEVIEDWVFRSRGQYWHLITPAQ